MTPNLIFVIFFILALVGYYLLKFFQLENELLGKLRHYLQSIKAYDYVLNEDGSGIIRDKHQVKVATIKLDCTADNPYASITVSSHINPWPKKFKGLVYLRQFKNAFKKLEPTEMSA